MTRASSGTADTAGELTGLIPVSRVWSGAKVLAEDLVGEDLGDVLDLHDGALAWWVLDRSSDYARNELRRLVTEFGLDPTVVHELVATDYRAKFEEIGQARLVLTNAITVDPRTAEVTVHPMSLLLTNRALICLVDVTREVDPRRWLTMAGERLSTGGTEAALQVVMTAVVDSYAGVVDWLERSSDELADKLFNGHPLSKDEQLWCFRLRNALTDVRRITEPMRTVMTDLRTERPVARKGQQKPALLSRRWALINEQHERVAGTADSLRESMIGVLDTSLALAGVQLNVIMKKLTGWAAIIAVPTLISGVVETNVIFPLSDTWYGFWFYLVVMISIGVALYVTFKRKDWI